MGDRDDITSESRALRSRIERAAIDLSLEHGYENVTIEMICGAGGCSRRTFFNHFGSKQGAILGPPPPVAAEADVATFVAGSSVEGNILDDFIQLMTKALTPAPADRDLFRERRIVIADDPVLLDARMRDVDAMQRSYIPIILRRMVSEGRTVDTDPAVLDDAEMIITITTAIMQFATQLWVRPSYTGTDEQLIPTSMAILRRVTGKHEALGS